LKKRFTPDTENELKYPREIYIACRTSLCPDVPAQ
jgi:hypothetical protein